MNEAYGVLYADRYYKTLYNFMYWPFDMQVQFLGGTRVMEHNIFCEGAWMMLEQRIKIQKGWMTE